MELLGIWVAAILTLCIFSFLYKDNPAYDVAQNLFVGLTLGYVLVVKVLKEGIFGVIKDQFFATGTWTIQPDIAAIVSAVIAILLGLLFFSSYVPKWSWLVTIVLALTIGWGSGIVISAELSSKVYAQVTSTILDFQGFSEKEFFSGSKSQVNTVLMLVGVICTLTYFFFSVEHRGVPGKLAKIGVIFIMISFGASFANAVAGRVTLLIGRMTFLLGDWLHLI
jgi:MFS family permease